ESGGPAAAPAGGSFALRVVAAAKAFDEAGPHVSLAGVRTKRARLRPVDGARLEVHRYLVAVARLEDPAEDSARCPVRAGCPVGRPDDPLSPGSFAALRMTGDWSARLRPSSRGA